MSETNNIFLTGVTGALGKELLKELYFTTKCNFFVLMRSDKKRSYLKRAEKLLENLELDGEPGNRIVIMNGDVTIKNFGLSDNDLEALFQKTNKFFHIAALTNLNGSEEDCERINVGGVLNAIDIANKMYAESVMENFFYFSTAYVAGSMQTYCSYEDELAEKPAWSNFYESSKYKAESYVRQAIEKGLPATIFRPSVVVGDSKTGVVSEFNVVYPFIRLFVHGMLTKIVTRLENSINIVPIDFVVKATCEIIKHFGIIGKTYHLVTPEPPTIKMLLQIPKEEPRFKFPKFKVIDPDDFKEDDLNAEEKFIYKQLKPYTGYLNGQLDFDMSNTVMELKNTEVSLPKTDYKFLKILYKYAVDVGYFKLQKGDYNTFEMLMIFLKRFLKKFKKDTSV